MHIGANFVVICILVLTLTAGCGDSDDSNPVSSVLTQKPVVTGLIETDEAGNQRGVWGVPTSTFYPYPNPSNSSFAIEFFADNAHVTIWIVNAYGPAENPEPPEGAGSGQVVQAVDVVRHLFDGNISNSGLHAVIWGGKDDAGHPAPDGFYRIYLQNGASLEWADVLLINDLSKLYWYLSQFKYFE